MKVVVKVNFGEDNRRITFEEKPSFNALYQLVKNLFNNNPGNNFSGENFSIKYVDDEGDLISLTCDREIEEAWKYAVGVSKTQILKLKVVMDENGAKPQAEQVKSEDNIKGKHNNDTNNVSDTFNDAVHQATETFNSVVDKIMAEIKNLQTKTTDVKEIVNTIQTSTLQDLIHHLQGLLKQWLIKGLLFQMLNPSNSSNNKKSKHNLISTIIKLIPVLTNLGVDNIFTQFLPILTSIFNPRDPKSEIHNAVCDACNQSIIGVRYKCSICPDFDLCEKCELKCQQLHNPNHPFLKVHNRMQANSLNNNASNSNNSNNNNNNSNNNSNNTVKNSNKNSNSKNNVESEDEEEMDEKDKRREDRDRRREERRRREREERREDRDKDREEKRKQKAAKKGSC